MRVLFVVKEFLPKPTPPGLCIMSIQRALYDLGVRSDVLMVGDEEGLYTSSEIGDIYSIKSEIAFEKGKEDILKYLMTRIPMVLTWPVPSIKRVKDYRRVIARLNEKYQYDAIIGTMFPPDVCVACSVSDHFFYYELDSLINNPMYKEGFKKYLHGRLDRLERKLFDRAELIIHLNNNKKFYAKKKYEQYARKSVYTDIPELTEDKAITIVNQEKRNEKILMVYSGHLSKEYRPPTRLIELIKELSKQTDIECLFFSRGDCENELRKAEEETKHVIKRMGYVSQKELKDYIDRADFLLDIGNRLTGEDYSLPSKVICYMATGKPIIHINGVNDSAIEYLQKYGLAVNVAEKVSVVDAAKEVMAFMNSTYGKHIPFSEVERKFPENTPAYTAELIINQIKRRKENNKQ